MAEKNNAIATDPSHSNQTTFLLHTYNIIPTMAGIIDIK
jgi:hypothetical protein